MASAPKAQAVPRTKHRVRMAVPAVTKNINEDEGLDQGDIEGEDMDVRIFDLRVQRMYGDCIITSRKAWLRCRHDYLMRQLTIWTN